MRTITLLLLFALSLQGATAQQFRDVNYKENKEDFPNPERGFYIAIGTRAGDFKPLDPAILNKHFHNTYKEGKAHYAIRSTLLMREYTLDSFRFKPLSENFLHLLEQDFAMVRQAGIKLVLRFAYINQAKNGDCSDIYKICPPYGDAPKAMVLKHIAQLAPVLKKNADIIAVLQEGFIGIWGENFYTDYFGDPGKNGPGRIMDSSWNDRNEVLHALLAAMPEDRMIQVRTPQIKQKYVYGPSALVTSAPLTPVQAFTGADIARIGFHNDCFLASDDDYGTYFDYGSSNSPQRQANAQLRQYVKNDSRYLPIGGETCDDAFSPQNDCAPIGHAEEEMAAMHYSFLNSGYNNDVNNDWDSLGCISSIRQKLGYRFVLRTARFPAKAAAGAPFSFTIHLTNKGYASPYNPRPAQLVFRNKTTGIPYALSTHTDPRQWFTGEQTWTETIVLPSDLPAGSYDLLLAFPDKSERLSANPAYSIRLANDDCWEAATGYNRLGCTVSVTAKK